MRSKEDAHDYRYFPEPDILQVNFTDEMLDAIKAKLPELPHKRLERYIGEYGLSAVDAKIIVNQKTASDFFNGAVAAYNNPKAIASFIIVELLRRVNLGEVSMDNLPFDSKDFAKLVEMAETEKISKNDAKAILRQMIETGKDAQTLAKENGFLIVTDMAKVNEIIKSVLSEKKEVVEQYLSGEEKVFGFLMGQCTKALKGVCTPKAAKDTLNEILSAMKLDSESKNSAQSENNAAAENESASTEKVSKYINSNAYKPSVKDGIMQINGSKLIEEFEIETAKANIGKNISFVGCIHKIRQMGGFAFIVIRTGRYLVQTVYSADNCKDAIADLKEGAFVQVGGTVTENDKAFHNIEIILNELKAIHQPGLDYPLHVSQKKLGCSLDINLDMRSVSLRNAYERAIFKLQEGVCNGFREFMLKNNFTEIHTPKIVAQGAEGGANIFHLEYFDKPAFLNQSPQFYKQTAVAFIDRVFEIAPVYRAEKHATSRHINEYIGLDFEMGYIDSMYDVMAMETAMLKYVMEYIKENYAHEIEMLEADIPVITDIPCVTLLEAKEILGNKGSKNKLDLEPEDEVSICEYAKKTFGSDFIFVTHFPSSKPPFYAMNSREDSRLAYKFDLLFRGLEITSGGQRIHDYNEQIAKMKAQGLDPNDFTYYLEAHKYGLPPHGGLGIGLERLVMKLLNLSNVRQTSMFPRDINRLLP